MEKAEDCVFTLKYTHALHKETLLEVGTLTPHGEGCGLCLRADTHTHTQLDLT